MRRQIIVVALALLFVGAVAVSADEAVLIDFSLLKADLADPTNQGVLSNNKATMMDFSSVAGASYTDAQKQQMRVSLAIPNWDIVLASSSRTILNQTLSHTAEAQIPQEASQFAGKTVFGIRVHFPTESYNSWARVTPPFEIPAFEPKATVDDQGNITPVAKQAASSDPNSTMTRFEGSYDPNTKIVTALGIVKNVGVIKTVAVTIRGKNFPHGLSLVLKDADGNEKVIFMGYLNFDGWKELRWDNPQYVTDVRNRELRIFPLYPKTVPFVKFDGFLITRDGANEGGDFITYIKDVKILYDKAVLVDSTKDIEDESVWGIVAQKEAARKLSESRRFGHDQVMRYLERQKQENKTDFASDSTAAAPATK
jgi:hypothetical protein